MANPAHLWALRGVIAPYAKWLAGQKHAAEAAAAAAADARVAAASTPSSPATFLQRSPRRSRGTMSKHQLGLADRQCRMSELSQRMQDAVTILCTSLYAARQSDEVVRAGRRHRSART